MNVYKVQTKSGSIFYVTAETVKNACALVEPKLFYDEITLVQNMGKNSEILYE